MVPQPDGVLEERGLTIAGGTLLAVWPDCTMTSGDNHKQYARMA